MLVDVDMASRQLLQANFRSTVKGLAASRLPLCRRLSGMTPVGIQSVGLESFRRTCSTSFSIQEILPPQDAFAQRHLGPRKSERDDMLRFLNLEVFTLQLLKFQIIPDKQSLIYYVH